MSPAKREPRAITIAELESRFDVAGASYWFGHTWCPAVGTIRGGYQVRFIKSETVTLASRQVSYDWFELDADGLVLVAPRGYARDFKPGRVVDIAEAVERYATPPSDAKRFRL